MLPSFSTVAPSCLGLWHFWVVGWVDSHFGRLSPRTVEIVQTGKSFFEETYGKENKGEAVDWLEPILAAWVPVDQASPLQSVQMSLSV